MHTSINKLLIKVKQSPYKPSRTCGLKEGEAPRFQDNRHMKFYSILQTGHITLSSTPDQLLVKPQHKIPHAAITV